MWPLLLHVQTTSKHKPCEMKMDLLRNVKLHLGKCIAVIRVKGKNLVTLSGVTACQTRHELVVGLCRLRWCEEQRDGRQEGQGICKGRGRKLCVRPSATHDCLAMSVQEPLELAYGFGEK